MSAIPTFAVADDSPVFSAVIALGFDHLHGNLSALTNSRLISEGSVRPAHAGAPAFRTFAIFIRSTFSC